MHGWHRVPCGRGRLRRRTHYAVFGSWLTYVIFQSAALHICMHISRNVLWPAIFYTAHLETWNCSDVIFHVAAVIMYVMKWEKLLRVSAGRYRLRVCVCVWHRGQATVSLAQYMMTRPVIIVLLRFTITYSTYSAFRHHQLDIQYMYCMARSVLCDPTLTTWKALWRRSWKPRCLYPWTRYYLPQVSSSAAAASCNAWLSTDQSVSAHESHHQMRNGLAETTGELRCVSAYCICDLASVCTLLWTGGEVVAAREHKQINDTGVFVLVLIKLMFFIITIVYIHV